MNDEFSKKIEKWRKLTLEEQTEILRSQVVDEVVGNMKMEGQPPSEQWIKQAKK